jgi:hypothetical protein
MKITDSEVIKTGEQELIDAITADLDWGAIEDIFRKDHNLGIEEDVEYKRGDMIVHDNRIAYQLDFEVKVTISLLLDREGNYISVKTADRVDPPEDNRVSPEDGQGSRDEDSEQGFPEVFPEDHPGEGFQDDQPTSAAFPDENPEDKITRMASRAGELMEALGE